MTGRRKGERHMRRNAIPRKEGEGLQKTNVYLTKSQRVWLDARGRSYTLRTLLDLAMGVERAGGTIPELTDKRTESAPDVQSDDDIVT